MNKPTLVYKEELEEFTKPLCYKLDLATGYLDRIILLNVVGSNYGLTVDKMETTPTIIDKGNNIYNIEFSLNELKNGKDFIDPFGHTFYIFDLSNAMINDDITVLPVGTYTLNKNVHPHTFQQYPKLTINRQYYVYRINIKPQYNTKYLTLKYKVKPGDNLLNRIFSIRLCVDGYYMGYKEVDKNTDTITLNTIDLFKNCESVYIYTSNLILLSWYQYE